MLSPAIVKQYLVDSDSPMAHKLLIDLVCSAKHERFLKLLELAVIRAMPEDENSLFESLNVFESATDNGR